MGVSPWVVSKQAIVKQKCAWYLYSFGLASGGKWEGIKYTGIASNIISLGLKKKFGLVTPNATRGSYTLHQEDFFSLCLNVFDHIVWASGLLVIYFLTLRAWGNWCWERGSVAHPGSHSLEIWSQDSRSPDCLSRVFLNTWIRPRARGGATYPTPQQDDMLILIFAIMFTPKAFSQSNYAGGIPCLRGGTLRPKSRSKCFPFPTPRHERCRSLKTWAPRN